MVGDANRYFAAEKPFDKKQTDPSAWARSSTSTAEVVRQIAILGAAGDAGRRRPSCSTCWRSTDGARTFAALGAGGRLVARHRAAGAGRRLPALRRSGGRDERRKQPRGQARAKQAKADKKAADRAKNEAAKPTPDARRSSLPSRLPAVRRRTATAVVARAQAAGVGVLVTISTRIRQLPELLRHRRARYDNVYCSVGTHPASSRTRNSTSRSTRSCGSSQHPKVRRRSARRASTTSTRSRRRGAGRRLPPPHRAPRAAPACRSRSTPAMPTTTRIAHPRRRARQGRRSRRSCTASPAGASSRVRAVELGLYVSFSGVITFKKIGSAARHRARRSARPAAGRDRRAVPRARALSRQDATSRPTSSTPRARWPRSRACRRDETGGGDDGELLPPVHSKVPRALAADGTPSHELPPHHPRLRLVRRRAAHRHDWGACDPANPKNRRRRCSRADRAHRRAAGATTVLIDTVARPARAAAVGAR